MFNIGGWEMAILAIAGLLFFGPDKLPQLMRQAGKIMREIKKASSEFQYSIERELDEDKYAREHRRSRKRAKKLAKLKAEQDAEGGGLMVGVDDPAAGSIGGGVTTPPVDPAVPASGEPPAGTVPVTVTPPATDPVPAAAASVPVASDPSVAPASPSTKTGS